MTLIMGKKGSGKTKKLVDSANNATQKSNGNVVVIEKGSKLIYDISHESRLIDIEKFKIEGFDRLYGFVCGICATNYDVTDIFIDSVLRIGGDDLSFFENFALKINELSSSTKVNFVMSVSEDENVISQKVKSISKKI